MTRTFEGFPRIAANSDVMAGKPCIRGMRVTVDMILGELGAETTPDELLADYPYLEREDIFEALSLGAWLDSERGTRLDQAERGFQHAFI